MTATQPSDPAPAAPKFRNWLRRNKIFFDTITATFLAIAAIIVSIVQATIASRQAEIAAKQNALADKQTSLVDLQTRIAEAQALPVFEIRIAQQFNPDTKHVDDNFLTIDNTGGPVHELSSRSIYSLEISAALLKPPVTQFTLFIPVDDYFAVSAVTPVGKGRLITTMGHNNNRVIGGFMRDLREGAKSRNWMYANAEERIYIHLFYLDILNREHEEYYRVEAVYGGSRISNEEGRAAFDKWRSAQPRHMSDLSVDKVFDELSALENKSALKP